MPWSEWITVGVSGWRLRMAIPRAEVTRPEVAERSMDQPTTRRLKGVEDDCAVDLAFSGWMLGVGVGPGRPVSFSAGGFPRPALRTGRATSTASGFRCVHAAVVVVLFHGVGILLSR